MGIESGPKSPEELKAMEIEGKKEEIEKKERKFEWKPVGTERVGEAEYYMIQYHRSPGKKEVLTKLLDAEIGNLRGKEFGTLDRAHYPKNELEEKCLKKAWNH